MPQIYRRSAPLPNDVDISIQGMDERITIPEGTLDIVVNEDTSIKCGLYFRAMNGTGNGCAYFDRRFQADVEKFLGNNSYNALNDD